MTNHLARRLHHQLLAGNGLASAHAVVAHFGAMQAQDYLGALWAVGVRMRGRVVEADVEREIAERRIVRCWPMRGTLHFVAAEDVRWMLELLAPRVLARNRARLAREFGLDAATLRRCRTAVERALRGGHALTRAELYAALDRAGVATGEGRGLHVLFALAHERLICFGARRGKQPSFVLLDEWLPPSPPKPRDEALAELARRYLTSHGPATSDDLMWWSGLTSKEAKESIALAGPLPEPRVVTRPVVRLLPPFDEYTVAYRDRSAIIDKGFASRLNAGGGMLNEVMVVNGRVAGNWKRTLRGTKVEIAIAPFRELTERERNAVDREAARYARFLTGGTRS